MHLECLQLEQATKSLIIFEVTSEMIFENYFGKLCELENVCGNTW